jgi:hypothetical protein
MTDLCHEFGISRKTGYKIVDRYQQCGVQGLTVSSVLMSLHAMAMILTSSGTFLWHLLAIAINIWIVVYLRFAAESWVQVMPRYIVHVNDNFTFRIPMKPGKAAFTTPLKRRWRGTAPDLFDSRWTYFPAHYSSKRAPERGG